MQGTGLTLGELKTASSGAQMGGTAAVDVAVGVLLYFQAQVLKGLSRPACSLPGQAKVNVDATERFFLPQPESPAAFLSANVPQRPRARREVVAVGLTSGSGELWLFLSLQADALGDAVEI